MAKTQATTGAPKLATIVSKTFERFGYKSLSTKLWSKQREWRQWWIGDVDGFHNQKIFNGDQDIEKERMSMQLPKLVTERWASLLVGEKLKITAGSKEDDIFLQNQLSEFRFYQQIGDFVERAFAIGAGALIEGEDEDGIMWQRSIFGEQVFPASYENGKIKECAFAWEEVDGKDTIYSMIFYLLSVDGEYVLRECRVKENRGKVEFIPYDDKSEWIDTPLGTKIKMFQIFRPNVTNNIDALNPLGVSIFANAINHIKKCDMVYDGEYNEFELGRKKVFVDKKLVAEVNPMTVSGGSQVPVASTKLKRIFPTNTDEFYSTDFKDGKPLLQEYNPELRVEQYKSTLNSTLKLVGRAVGFGENYSFIKEMSAKTATEVMSENAEMFANRSKHLQLLREVLVEMARAILYLGKKDPTQDITVHFDDSVVEDQRAVREQALTDFNAGVIDVAEYLVRVDKLTRKQALTAIKDQSILNVSGAVINNAISLYNAGILTVEQILLDVLKIPKSKVDKMLKDKQESEMQSIESLLMASAPDIDS